MTTIGFIRVSTLDQDTEKNKLDMLQFANSHKLGNVEFVEFSNRYLINPDKDYLGFPISNRPSKAEFDIEIIPERQSPTSRETNNQLILELWKSGILSNTSPDMAIVILESMNFDGKERIIEQLKLMKRKAEGGNINGIYTNEQQLYQ